MERYKRKQHGPGRTITRICRRRAIGFDRYGLRALTTRDINIKRGSSIIAALAAKVNVLVATCTIPDEMKVHKVQDFHLSQCSGTREVDNVVVGARATT